jgi:tetratricopeptide (TPR) repeat protein
MAQLSATEIQSIYAEALKQQRAGQTDAALRGYGRIVEVNPDIAEAQFQIGRILTVAVRIPAAIAHLKKAAALKPAEKAIWLAWAEAVALGGEAADEDAFLKTLKGAQIAPDLRIALQDRFGARRTNSRPATGGVTPAETRALLRRLDERKLAEAERQAAALIARHPNSALAFNILGTAQALMGKKPAAEASIRRALQIDPDYAEAHDNLGKLLVDLKRPDEATSHFTRAVILAPGLPSALVNLALALNRGGNAAAGLVLLDRAQAGGANSAPLHMARGNLLTRLRQYDKAEAAFARAIAAAPAPLAEALALLAQAQARQGKDDLAMQNYDRALAAEPDSPIGLSGKALLLQTLARFDEAETLFRRCFEVDPLNGDNFRQFIASHKTSPGDPLTATMRERYDDPRMTATDRMNLGFAIAKALEDVKDYGSVFRYLDEANALMRKAAPWHISQRQREVDQTRAAYQDFDWQDARIEGTSDFAPIFVTGMPRSGTTLIEQIIATHSQVEGAGEVGGEARAGRLLSLGGRQPRPLAEVDPAEIAALGHDYTAQIRARFPDARHVTDKSIQTYMNLGLMKLALPNARFIIVRRDPRDTLLSMYKNKFPDDTHLYSYDQKDLALYYKTFVEMIDFWRDRVPDWFYEVEYEALVANPEVEARKLIAACGLPWEDACLNFHENKRKVETLSVFQVRQPISGGSVRGWKRYEKELQPMLTALRDLGLVAD